jgi:uncharacterized protein DUF5681
MTCEMKIKRSPNVDKKDKGKDKPDYSVGYKKPPEHTRFKPGQSGNSKGRPKKKTTVTEIISRQLRRTVTVNDGHKTRKVPLVDAILMTHISKAAKGDHRSTALVLGAMEVSESDPNNNLPDLLNQFRAIHEARLDSDHNLAPTRDGNDEENG